MLFPIVWSLFVSICSVVPIAHYRVKLIKAYSRSTASTNFTESWKLKSSLATLWIVSFFCSSFSFFNLPNQRVEVCVLTLAFSKDYLVPFFLFVTTITVMVATEYLRLIIFVSYGSGLGSETTGARSDKWHKFVQFDPRMSRVVLIMAGSFVACWIPYLASIFYYLHPFDSPTTARAHTITHWVHMLPLLHSTINPFIYSLSEKEFRQSIWETVHRVLPSSPNNHSWPWPLRAKNSSNNRQASESTLGPSCQRRIFHWKKRRIPDGVTSAPNRKHISERVPKYRNTNPQQMVAFDNRAFSVSFDLQSSYI